jgi:hypothetical protein
MRSPVMPSLTNYSFTWCSLLINVIFNTCFSSVICYIGRYYFEDIVFKLSFWIVLGELYENYHYRTDFSFYLWIVKVFKINIIFLNLSSLGHKFKLKFIILWNFELLNFIFTRFYCIWIFMGHYFKFILFFCLLLVKFYAFPLWFCCLVLPAFVNDISPFREIGPRLSLHCGYPPCLHVVLVIRKL